MKVWGEKVLARRPGEIWRALHDPDVLSRAIPGGGTVRETETGIFAAAAETSIMGMKATYEGEIRFLDEIPESYCRINILAEGPLGPVNGEGELFLSESGEGTQVKYNFDADVGGGSGMFGGGALVGFARKMVDKVLERLDGD